jgi:hypothetical protein
VGPTGAAAGPTELAVRDQTAASTTGAPSEPARPLNLLFGAAVLVGIGLLLVSRLVGRQNPEASR